MERINKKICIVIPTKNEENQISQTIEEINEIFFKNKIPSPTIIVVDDSKDRTRKIAKKQGAVVVNGGGKGLGYAMFKGLKFALRYKPDYIVSYDADGQCDAEEIPVFLSELENDNADLVLGSRFKKPGLVFYKYPFINRTGTIILSRILSSFTKLPLTDSHGGVRAMLPEVVEELEMIGTHTYVQETIIDAYEKGFRIKELPSVWKKREHGKSRVVSSIPTYIFYTLPILILRSKQHIKWLYSIGISFVLVAICYFLWISYQANFNFKGLFNRLPALLLITSLVMTGIQLFFFGFILQLIKDIKYSVSNFKKISESEAIE